MPSLPTDVDDITEEHRLVELNGLQDGKKPEDDEQEIEVRMVVPPDGGWGWVIVFASFMCNLIVDGIIFSFGSFLMPIADAFSVSKANVALVSSLQTGFYLMSGPFVSALANKYGFRPVAILGSVISAVAFVLSVFAQSVGFLCVSFGLLGGIGTGLIYVPAVISAGFYFERWRALATGIAVCGSGIGTFVVAPLTGYLIENFGWRGALFIHAGMLLNCAVFGALLRPLMPTRVKVKQPKQESDGTNGDADLGAKTSSMGCLYTAQPNGRGILGTNNNTEFSTAAQIIGSSSNIVNSRSLHSLHKDSHAASRHEKQNEQKVKRLSAPIYPELEVVADQELKTVEEENNLLSGDLERLNGRIPTVRRHTVCGKRDRSNSDTSQKSYRAKMAAQSKENIQRPFYRDDIFYGGSLHRLPHYKSQMSSVGYHMSVTRLPTEADVEEEGSEGCLICPEGVRRILATMLDTSLLKNISFLILAVSGFLTMMGFYVPFLYLPSRAEQSGIDKSTAGFLVSVIGITNTIGRILCGVASSMPGVNALLINNIFLSVAGIITILSNVSTSETYQFFYAALFGVSVSVFAALRSILIVDLVGLEKLTNGFGLALLFQGLAASMGAPLAGVFVDITGNYDVSFYISGALILASAVICYPLDRINRWEERRRQNKAEDSKS